MQIEGALDRVPPRTIIRRQLAADDVLKVILDSLDDSKAEGVISLNITGKSALADYMVVVTGRSQRHVGAIADHVTRDLSEAGHRVGSVEGMPSCDWVLIDAGDVIVHVFRPDVRSFYNLEKMWSADLPQQTAAPRPYLEQADA